MRRYHGWLADEAPVLQGAVRPQLCICCTYCTWLHVPCHGIVTNTPSQGLYTATYKDDASQE
jgi:hypothetical protein